MEETHGTLAAVLDAALDGSALAGLPRVPFDPCGDEPEAAAYLGGPRPWDGVQLRLWAGPRPGTYLAGLDVPANDGEGGLEWSSTDPAPAPLTAEELPGALEGLTLGRLQALGRL